MVMLAKVEMLDCLIQEKQVPERFCKLLTSERVAAGKGKEAGPKKLLLALEWQAQMTALVASMHGMKGQLS